MGFSKSPAAGKDGLDNKAGSTIAADEKSNINWQKGGQRVGLIKGRLKFGKQSVSSLNTGVCTYQDSDKDSD